MAMIVCGVELTGSDVVVCFLNMDRGQFNLPECKVRLRCGRSLLRFCCFSWAGSSAVEKGRRMTQWSTRELRWTL